MTDTPEASRRLAVVVGGSGGIGYATAEMLAGEGFDLVLVARDPARLATASTRLAELGADVMVVPTNINRADEVSALFDRIRSRHRRLDLLVNSAGVAIRAELADSELRHISLQVGVNLEGVILVCRLAYDLLRDTAAAYGLAQVINVGSYVGGHPTPTLAVYSAAKAGTQALSTALNREWGAQGIRCTVISPGYVATSMADRDLADRDQRPLLEASDVADTVRFLIGLSPRCVIPEVEMLRPGLVP
jgi:short-subunit dehydrogenase